MTKQESGAIEDAYGDKLKLFYSNLFEAYIQSSSAAERKQADAKFTKGLQLARDVKASALALLGT
jgi:hypothetical protein